MSLQSRRPAVFLDSEHYRQPGFGSNHPLAFARVSAVVDLCTSLGWLSPDELRACPGATVERLCEFHDRAYVEALRDADARGRVDLPVREAFAIGTSENPLFPGVFARAAAAVGGSILAAELALAGAVVFHPGGGTHHGRPGRASGFCYFNDPVFALRTFIAGGCTRILYVDLDAHHGDGVQDAMRDEPHVHTISLHEAGRWPHTGAVEDAGAGRACNYPVPAGFNDDELDFLMQAAVLPYAEQLQPDALVITCGTDALAGDPLSGLQLGNGALWRAVEQLVQRVPAAVVLGGGGYNPWTLVRCWAGLWARLSGRELPDRLPPPAQAILGSLGCDLIDDDDIKPQWLTTLADAPRGGSVRAAVRDLVPRAASARRAALDRGRY